MNEHTDDPERESSEPEDVATEAIPEPEVVAEPDVVPEPEPTPEPEAEPAPAPPPPPPAPARPRARSKALLQAPEGPPQSPSRTAVGVSFRRSGKVYYFAMAGVPAEIGDRVIAATEKGVDIGDVVEFRPTLGPDDAPPLKPLLRKATPEDIAIEEDLQAREKEVMRVADQKVVEHGLPMKLIEADYSFDGQRLVIFFGAEGRVDFRDLVRDLAETFRCRIELRQIGVRDEAKMIGGYGPCGRALCCTTFLRNFDAVGIRVAKDQGLALNPAKISGVCDRLMCCLKYEHEVYKHLAHRLPKIGQKIMTPKGEGIVKHVILLKEQVIAELPGGEYMELKITDSGVAEEAKKPEEKFGADEFDFFETTSPGVKVSTDGPIVVAEPAALAVGEAGEAPAAEEPRGRRSRRGERKPRAKAPAAETPGEPAGPPSDAPPEAPPASRPPRAPRQAGQPRQAPAGKPAPFVPPTAGAPAGAGQPASAAAPETPEGSTPTETPEGEGQRKGRSRRGRRRRGGGGGGGDKGAQQPQGDQPQADQPQAAGAPKPAEGKPVPAPFRPPTTPSERPAPAERSAPSERPAAPDKPASTPVDPASGEPKAEGERTGRSRRGGRPYYRRRGSRPGSEGGDAGGGSAPPPSDGA